MNGWLTATLVLSIMMTYAVIMKRADRKRMCEWCQTHGEFQSGDCEICRDKGIW